MFEQKLNSKLKKFVLGSVRVRRGRGCVTPARPIRRSGTEVEAGARPGCRGAAPLGSAAQSDSRAVVPRSTRRSRQAHRASPTRSDLTANWPRTGWGARATRPQPALHGSAHKLSRDDRAFSRCARSYVYTQRTQLAHSSKRTPHTHTSPQRCRRNHSAQLGVTGWSNTCIRRRRAPPHPHTHRPCACAPSRRLCAPRQEVATCLA